MWLRILTYFWLLFTLYLLLKPGIGYEQVVFFKHEDKVAHFGLFSTLTLLWIREIKIDFGLSFNRSLILTFFLGTFLGGFTEFLQQFIPYRGMDFDDFAVDVIAVLFGILVAFSWEKMNRTLVKSHR